MKYLAILVAAVINRVGKRNDPKRKGRSLDRLRKRKENNPEVILERINNFIDYRMDKSL